VSIARVTPELIDIIPYISEYSQYNGKTAAYVCKNSSCMAPVTEVEKLKQILNK